MSDLPEKIILWGAVGQAKLVKDVADYYGSQIAAVFDDNPAHLSPFPGTPIYHGWEAFVDWADGQDKASLGFCISINGRGKQRLELHEKIKQMGISPVTLIHHSAIIARSAVIGEGSQVMAGVIIGPDARIGRQCIINAGVSIDHDNVLEDGVEISPGATLCGLVKVGANAWIAAGATVLPMVKIGPGAMVGAGAVVNREVPADTTVVGVPAKPIVRK